MNALPLPAIAEDIWDMKYRLKDNQTGQPLDADIHATWARAAAALASAEPEHEPRPKHRAAFMRAIADYRFLPAGRIIAGAGAGRNVTLFNCYVMGDPRRPPARADSLYPARQGSAPGVTGDEAGAARATAAADRSPPCPRVVASTHSSPSRSPAPERPVVPTFAISVL